MFATFEKGISRGCPLSPLMGAFFLGDLDARLERQTERDDLFYAYKTFVGRIPRGFDFLGRRLAHDGAGQARLGLSAKTVARFNENVSAL